MAKANGRVVQVMGPVVDVEFPPGSLPELYVALRITNPGIDEREFNLVVEVAMHLGENTVRCIAMDTTDGLVRNQPVKNTGEPIRVPVGVITSYSIHYTKLYDSAADRFDLPDQRRLVAALVDHHDVVAPARVAAGRRLRAHRGPDRRSRNHHRGRVRRSGRCERANRAARDRSGPVY